ncbi:hypothetical protein ACFLSU_08985 [Bacteroidota bacterium]
MGIESFKKSFEKLKIRFKEDPEKVDQRDFYSIIEEMEGDIEMLMDKAEKHPNYKFRPSPDVPASMELQGFEELKDEIETLAKKIYTNDISGILDMMYPDHDENDIDISNFFKD